MALDNYSDLKQSIRLWSKRSDVVGQIANDCVTMAEQEIFYGATPIRLVEMVTETITASSTRKLAFPADMLELRNLSVEVDGCYHRLKIIPLQQMPDVDGDEGVPSAYCITNQFVFDVTPDQSYNFKIEYYAKPAALSDTDTTNIVLQKYPNAYLFGGIAAANLYASEEDRANEYTIRMRDVIAKANSDADNLQYGSLPTVFIGGVIP